MALQQKFNGILPITNMTAHATAISASPARTFDCCMLRQLLIGSRSTINRKSNKLSDCRKMLAANGNKVLLFPEESWARNAASVYWNIKQSRWRRTVCWVEEVAGSKKISAQARIVAPSPGALLIVGSFKTTVSTTPSQPDTDFKLFLSSQLTPIDLNMGYCLTGTLERGCRNANIYQTSHFAAVKRRSTIAISSMSVSTTATGH